MASHPADGFFLFANGEEDPNVSDAYISMMFATHLISRYFYHRKGNYCICKSNLWIFYF